MSTDKNLADALRNIVNMLRCHPTMQGREIAVNNALRAYNTALAELAARRIIEAVRNQA